MMLQKLREYLNADLALHDARTQTGAPYRIDSGKLAAAVESAAPGEIADALDCDAPDSVADELERMAQAYRESMGELSAAWQDETAGKIWGDIANIFDRAAASVRRAIDRRGL